MVEQSPGDFPGKPANLLGTPRLSRFHLDWAQRGLIDLPGELFRIVTGLQPTKLDNEVRCTVLMGFSFEKLLIDPVTMVYSSICSPTACEPVPRTRLHRSGERNGQCTLQKIWKYQKHQRFWIRNDKK